MYTSFKKAKSISKLSSEQGFSLIEILIVISIVAVIATIAAPAMKQSIANQKVKSAASTLRNALEEARIESVVRRKNVTVNLEGNVLTVKDSDNTISSYQIDQSIEITAAPSSESNNYVFEPTKRLSNGSVTFTVCSDNLGEESPRQVVASAITNIKMIKAGSCS